MRTFIEYYEDRFIEQILFEALSDTIHADVGVLTRDFLYHLGRYLPDGLRSLPSRIIDGVKNTLMSYKLRNAEGISVDSLSDHPSEDEIAMANRMVGPWFRKLRLSRQQQGEQSENLAYLLQLYNRQVRNTVKPGSVIDPQVYYKHFKNFIQNPSAGITSIRTITNFHAPSGNPKQAVVALAQNIIASTDDPQIHAAVKKSLLETIGEVGVRMLVLNPNNTTAGRQKSDEFLQTHGYTYDQFRDEKKRDPDLNRLYNREKRRSQAMRSRLASS